jgi:hypothetical protein
VLGFDQQIDAAVSWLEAREQVSAELAGWGWVPEITPNPQNSAETVCALHTVGVSVSELDKVAALLVIGEVQRHDGTPWKFDTTVDEAWAARALALLASVTGRIDLHAAAVKKCELLLGRCGSEGWAADEGNDASAFVTMLVMRAIGCAAPRMLSKDGPKRAWQFLIHSIENPTETLAPVSSVSYVLMALSASELQALWGSRSEWARRRGVEWLIERMAGDLKVEEEPYSRGPIRDRWRHLTLPLSLLAVALADPGSVRHPEFRRQLALLGALQESDGVNSGGYETSAGGIVTTYATTWSLEAMAAVRGAIEEYAAPADVWEAVCRAEGLYPTDPHKLVSVKKFRVIMNSSAALVFSVVASVLAALAVGLIIGAPPSELSSLARRVLFVTVFYLLSATWFAYVACRLPWIPSSRVLSAAAIITTAVLFPVLALLI